MSDQFDRLQIAAFNSGEQLTAGAQRLVVVQYKRALKEIDALLAEAFRKYSVSGELRMADVAKFGRLASLQKNIAKEARALGGKQIRITDSSLTDIYEDSYLRTGHAAEYGLNKRLSFSLLGTAVVAEAIKNPLDLITWQNRSKFNIQVMTRQIGSEITNGIIQGHGFSKMARSIKKRMDIGATKAMAIVRTEGHRVQMSAVDRSVNKALVYSNELGLGMEKVWDSILDQVTRSDHIEVDGQIADVDGLFTVGGVTTSSPGNTGVASQDINCRCGIRMQFPGETPRERIARNPVTGKNELIPFQPYTEWAKDRGAKPPKTPKKRAA